MVQSPTQILTGKFGRSLTPPGRDLYDFAVAGEVDPRSLTRAVNIMDPGWVDATLKSWQGSQKDLTKEGQETINGVPLWAEKYLEQPVAYAITGILNNSTRRLEVDTKEGSARAVCHTTKGPLVFEWEGLDELERGLTNSGIGLILERKGKAGDGIRSALFDGVASGKTGTVAALEVKTPKPPVGHATPKGPQAGQTARGTAETVTRDQNRRDGERNQGDDTPR